MYSTFGPECCREVNNYIVHLDQKAIGGLVKYNYSSFGAECCYRWHRYTVSQDADMERSIDTLQAVFANLIVSEFC